MTTGLYTSSRLRVIRTCLRMHHLRYVLALQTPETDQMRFGTVGHAALEAWYRAWMVYCPVCEGILGAGHQPTCQACECRGLGLNDRLFAAMGVIAASSLSDWDRIKLAILIRAYDARWGGEDWEVLAVEQEFRFLLGDDLIGGKIDAIIRDRKDGRVYVVEHKTTGVDASLGSAYWDRLTIDSQVSVYIDGAAMLGHEIAGCIYDVIKRPGHEPKLATPPGLREYTKGRGCKGCGGSAKPGAIFRGRGYYTVLAPGDTTPAKIPCDGCSATGWKLNAEGVPDAPRLHAHQRDTDESGLEFEARLIEAIAENPDATLLRGVVVRLEHEMPAMRQDLLDTISIAETGLTPRNTDACARHGQMCAYFDICAGRADIADETRFPRGVAHPELAAPRISI